MSDPKGAAKQEGKVGRDGMLVSADTSLFKSKDALSLKIGRRIGRGGFGDVFYARWGGIPCAVKVFYLSETAPARAEILKEIDLLSRLRHRRIISFYCAIDDDGKFSILMEYAENGSLQAAIDTPGCLDWDAKQRIAREVLQGLSFIHSEKVIHRDLKSGNVLLNKYMEAKLCDFGLSAVAVATATKSTVERPMGTIRWMAPELFVTKPKYNTKTDMYAFGWVLWEMAADCTTPFKEQLSTDTILVLVKQGKREDIPENTPENYSEWIKLCWDSDPSKRPEADFILMDDSDLEQVLAEENSDNTRLVSFSFGDDESTVFQDQGIAEIDEHLCHAEDNDPNAQFEIGMRYLSVDGESRSDFEGLFWIRRAAEGGHAEAQYHIGCVFEHGQEIAKNVSLAIHWYERAADYGIIEALHYSRMLASTEQQVAMLDLQMQADDKDKNAQYALAMMFLRDRGAIISNFDTLYWVRCAADKGHAMAHLRIGEIYEYGGRLPVDIGRAVLWYKKAVEQGHLQAQHNLSTIKAQSDSTDNADTEEIAGRTRIRNSYEAVIILDEADSLSDREDWSKALYEQGSDLFDDAEQYASTSDNESAIAKGHNPRPCTPKRADADNPESVLLEDIERRHHDIMFFKFSFCGLLELCKLAAKGQVDRLELVATLEEVRKLAIELSVSIIVLRLHPATISRRLDDLVSKLSQLPIQLSTFATGHSQDEKAGDAVKLADVQFKFHRIGLDASKLFDHHRFSSGNLNRIVLDETDLAIGNELHQDPTFTLYEGTVAHRGLQEQVYVKVFKDLVGAATSTFIRRSTFLTLLLEGFCGVIQPKYMVEPNKIILEHTAGDTLDRVSLSPTQKIDVALKVASIIAVVHSWGIVHQDVRAANVVMVKRRQLLARNQPFQYIPKLSGFETCCFPGVYDKELVPRLERTVWYAPEREMWRSSFASDVFAFGVLMYEVSMGRPPIARNNIRVSEGDVDRWMAEEYGNISDAYSQLMIRCLYFDHRVRPSMEQVVETLVDISTTLIEGGTSTHIPFRLTRKCSIDQEGE